MTSDAQPATPDVFDEIAQSLPAKNLRTTLASVMREKSHEHDLYMRLLTSQRRHDERVWSAARRSAIFEAGTVFELAGRQRLEAVTHVASELAYRAQNLGVHPKKQGLTDLVETAERLTWAMKVNRDLADTAATAALRTSHDEIARLRAYTMIVGRELHEQLGDNEFDGGCECAGCRLIINLDLTPVLHGPKPPESPDVHA